MNFTPLSDEELQVAALLPEALYSYQVVKSEDKMSKAGNEYTAITLKVWDNEGKEHLIFTNMALMKLLKHFCDVNEMQSEYLSGNIPADAFMYKAGGRVHIGVEGEKPNPTGGMYKAKNIVKDYLAGAKPSGMKPLPEKSKDFIDDDLPF